MNVARSVAEVLRDHVTLEIESIDRMYLNLYVPILQRPEGAAYFCHQQLGQPIASSTLFAPLTEAFVGSIEKFAKGEGIELIRFRKGERKDEVAAEFFQRYSGTEGVVFIGKAQEKASVPRTERRRNPNTGQSYPWLVASTALVNHYYFYCLDEDFGPLFVKFCSYFPYNGKVCLNGHEYLKRQLEREGIGFEALDNGLLSCADGQRAQQIAEELTAERIEQVVRKWLGRLPHPFREEDRQAGFGHDISILQAEFSLTQVLDRPQTGRIFFEQVIRDNLDLGRPDRVQLVFHRRINRKTPSRFRTRVVTEGVVPSLYVDYKNSRIKQYHKEGRALRTETTINNTYDFAVGKRLKNLSALRRVGFQANRRLLDVQRISHDCWIGEETFQALHQPVRQGEQRASALRFGDPRVLVLLAALLIFRLLPQGFANRDLRPHLAVLLGDSPEDYAAGRMTYDLRRLRMHGLIERIPRSHRYRVTDQGFRIALFVTRSYHRLLRPGLSTIGPIPPPASVPLHKVFASVDQAIEKAWDAQQIAA